MTKLEKALKRDRDLQAASVTKISTGYESRIADLTAQRDALLAENKRLKQTLDAAMRSRDRIIDEWTPPNRAIAQAEGK